MRPHGTAARRLAAVPAALVALRAALAPVMLVLTFAFHDRAAFGACLGIALVSDGFDGILARRLGVATERLRRLDSAADSLFYATAIVAVWITAPAVLRERFPIVAALIGLELLRYALDFAKFRREASYHMWSAKVWGLFLFAAFFSVLALGHDGIVVDAAIYAGILCDLEGIAASLLLDRPLHDVPSVFHAWRLRNAGQ